MDNSGIPRIWITYAWADNNDGDFEYLVAQLAEVGVEALYDRIRLIAGQRLWEQIESEIMDEDLDGWAILMTPASLASEPCREELAYAVDRALNAKKPTFPLIGLAQGVTKDDVPAAIRTRLYVSLRDPDWRERVKAALESRPVTLAPAQATRYVWRAYTGRSRKGERTVIEVRPRFGDIGVWRFTTLADVNIDYWTDGPAGGAPAPGVWHYSHDSSADAEFNDGTKIRIRFVGCANAVSPSRSAWLVIDGPIPKLLAFGPVDGLRGGPKIGPEQEPIPANIEMVAKPIDIE